jgi:hypothetical protein
MRANIGFRASSVLTSFSMAYLLASLENSFRLRAGTTVSCEVNGITAQADLVQRPEQRPTESCVLLPHPQPTSQTGSAGGCNGGL